MLWQRFGIVLLGQLDMSAAQGIAGACTIVSLIDPFKQISQIFNLIEISQVWTKQTDPVDQWTLKGDSVFRILTVQELSGYLCMFSMECNWCWLMDMGYHLGSETLSQKLIFGAVCMGTGGQTRHYEREK